MVGEQYRSFFEAYLGPLPEADVNGEVCISNPFRRDSNPSLHINLDTGQFNDFGSDFRGDAFALYMEMHDADYAGARKAVEEYLAGKTPAVAPIDEALIEDWHQELMSNIPVRAYLVKDRGISVPTLKRYKIGWDGERYTIPIANKFGIYVNVRRYSNNAEGRMKMLPFKEGYGANKLFPIEVLFANDTVILHEGEWDTLLQLSKGFPALTNTAGAGSWNKART